MIFNFDSHKSKEPVGILDIGSTKLACIILLPISNEKFELMGHSIQASEGIKNGEIIDMTLLSNVIGKVIQSAEERASFTIKEINIVFSGGNPESENFSLSIKLLDPVISRRELTKLHFKETGIIINKDREIVQSQRLSYIIDQQENIKNPIGMKGNNLCSNINIISISKSAKENLEEALSQNHLKINQIHHTSTVCGMVCLNDEEKELGALIIDFGGEITSLTFFEKGNAIFTKTIPIGGSHITRDIATVLSVSLSDAERLKVVEGSLSSENLSQKNISFPFEGDNFIFSHSINNENILHLNNGEMIQRELLCNIIKSRVDEIIEKIEEVLSFSRIKHAFNKKIVITGGASQLTGLQNYLGKKMKKFIIIGKPNIQIKTAIDLPNNNFLSCFGMAYQTQLKTENKKPSFHSEISNYGVIGRSYHWFKNQILNN